MDYYKQIDKALKEYEEYRPYPQHSMEWICDRITWCWKFRHITHKQMTEFADRAVAANEISKYYRF